MDVLTQTKIGKILKYFTDFCRHYSWDCSKLMDLLFKAEQVQKKWKNYINNYLFDEAQDHTDSFKDNLNVKSEKFKRRLQSKGLTPSTSALINSPFPSDFSLNKGASLNNLEKS